MKGDGGGTSGGATVADADIDGLSYERALAELDQIIERLERGTVALDEAIAAYERGARLAQHCGDLLDRTEQKISQLVVGAGGRIAEKPLASEREVPELGVVAPGAPAGPAPRREQQLEIDPDEIPF
jgi:exodeoxyribonuclease VII small subunit